MNHSSCAVVEVHDEDILQASFCISYPLADQLRCPFCYLPLVPLSRIVVDHHQTHFLVQHLLYCDRAAAVDRCDSVKIWGVGSLRVWVISHWILIPLLLTYHFCSSRSQLEPNLETCFGPKLGYNVSSFIDLDEAGISPDIVAVVQDALFVVLVLHPVSAGLAFLSLIFSLFLASRALSIINLILTILNALVATVSMAIDLTLVLVARSRLASLGTFSIAIDFGNGVWLIVAGVILIWINVVLLSARACYCLGVRRPGYVSILAFIR